MFIDLLKEINEGRAESGRGSKKGREKYTSKGSKKGSVQAKKSRVRIFDTIEAALNSGASYGTIFSTKGADRLYVISKPDWGAKSTAGGNTKIAKGFTPGSSTPGSSWPSIKAHSVRTAIKHGAKKSKTLSKKYGAGRREAEGQSRATVGESYQPISEWDLFVEKVAFLKEKLDELADAPFGTGIHTAAEKKKIADKKARSYGDKTPDDFGAGLDTDDDEKPEREDKRSELQKKIDAGGSTLDAAKAIWKKKDDAALAKKSAGEEAEARSFGAWTGPAQKAAALRMGKKAAEVGGKGVGLAAKGVVGTAKLGAKGTKLAAKGAVKTTGLAAKGALKTTAAATKVASTGVTTASNLAGSAGRKALRTKIHGT